MHSLRTGAQPTRHPPAGAPPSAPQRSSGQLPGGSAPAQRALVLRRRPDLVVQPQWFRGRRYWVIKDPVALEYTKLREEEYAILELLDGQASLEDVRRQFNQRFAPLQLSARRLQAYLGTLHRAGLVLSGASGQGEQLWVRGRQRRGRQRWQTWTNVLAIRFRGVDAEPILDWLYPPMRWVFSWTCLAVWLLLAAGALTLVAVQFDQLQARLPDFQTFFGTRNVLWMGVALAVTKVLHELGHALACRHFGGECHEIGVMLLVMTPCLYCNVSDSWMLRNKWQRAAISAAGIYVEVFLASVCTFGWWFSQPGLLNTLCLNTMFVCSVGTVFLNGNPLLRYDGYYILSDVLEVPNLWQESRDVVHGWLGRVMLGWPAEQDRSGSPGRLGLTEWRLLLGGYGIASMAYRLVVLSAILFFVFETLEPLGLRVVAELILVLVVMGVVVVPANRALQFVRSPVRRRRIDWLRLTVSSLVVAAVVAVVAWMPLPFGVHAPMVVEAGEARHVHLRVDGRLAEALPAGSSVQAGDVVARLERPDLERQLQTLAADVSYGTLRLKNLESLRLRDPAAAQLIPAVKEQLEGKRQELAQQRRDVERLTLRAPVAGVVIGPPAVPEPRRADPRTLAGWWGSPLDPQNQGSWLEADTLVCLVGDPRRHDAVAYVEQSRMEFVRPGQRVRLRLDAVPGRILTGTVRNIAAVDVDSVPRVLAESGQLPTRPDSVGRLRPVETLFQVRIALDTPDEPLVIEACGRAKIVAAPQSLARRLYRYLSQTFGWSA